MQVYRGELETNTQKFQGKVWLRRFPDLVGIDKRVFVLHFEPGSRTNWHVHAGRQVMYGVYGKGCLVEKQGESTVMEPGDVVYLEPGVAHWHGASPGGDFIHAVIAFDQKTYWTFRQEDGTWAPRPVSDEVYGDIWAQLA